jgi:cell division septation protein DedD
MLRARSDAEPPDSQDEDELDLDSLSVEDLRLPGATRRRQAVRSARADGARRRSPILPVLVAAVALVCVAAGIFFGYSWFFAGDKTGALPVVRASEDPVKVKPESPGGLKIPYQDQLVLNQEGSEAGKEPVVERLLPPPETPRLPPSEPETADITAAAARPAQGRGIVEAPVPPAGTLVEVPPLASATEPAKPATTQVAQATGQAPAKGSYLVQLGSFTSTKGTNRAWATLKKAHPELLSDMSLFIQKATVNDRAYYRVQAGPIPNRATAQDMCAQLKARQQDCLVVRR